MKKQWKALVIACAATFAFAGCGGETDTGELTLEKVRTLYETVTQATKIEENIEIKNGALVQYTEEKAYTLDGDVYTVTGSAKQLNALEESEAYTVTEIESYTVNKAETFTGKLGLEDANVENVTAEENTLTLSVKDGKEKDFLKLQTLTEVSAMKAAFRVNDTTLGGIEITYTSGNSTVTVTIAFIY